ncbi:hypothetical protein EON63_11290 [archaeon]|nr:MAG: hypothetical protein EON63_11290 [archaeon]
MLYIFAIMLATYTVYNIQGVIYNAINSRFKLTTLLLLDKNTPMSQFKRKLINQGGNGTFVYNNPHDTYSPSLYVEWGHKISGADFEATTYYLKQCLYSPLIIMGLGLLSLISILIVICSRYCCAETNVNRLPAGQSHPRNPKPTKTYVYIVVAFCLLVLLVVLFAQLSFIGNTRLDKGIHTMDDSVLTFKDIAVFLRDISVALLGFGNDLETYYLEAQQTYNSTYLSDSIGEDIHTYVGYVEQIRNILQDIIHAMLTIHLYATQEGTYYRNIVVYGLWSLATLSGILFFLTLFLQGLCITQFTFWFGLFTYFLFLMLSAVWLLLTTVFAGLCMKPTENIIMALPDNKHLQNIVLYYVSCTGNNTIMDNANKSREIIHHMNDSLFTFVQSNMSMFDNSPALRNLSATLSSIDLSMPDIEDFNTACPIVRELWFQFINKGLCLEAYTGVFYIWGSELLTSFFLFLLCIVGFILYQYYNTAGSYDNVDEESKET